MSDWPASDPAARISDVDQAAAALNQPARRPCDENERKEHNINPVNLNFEIPARTAHTWIAHVTLAHGHLKQLRMQLPLCEYFARALQNPEQSEHRQDRGGCTQKGADRLRAGFGTARCMRCHLYSPQNR